jgi:shikimate dehydrogenase
MEEVSRMIEEAGGVGMIDARTKLYGVIGNPIRHSLSPVIHNNAFKRMGWDGIFLAFEIQHLEKAVTGIRALGLQGASVTMPFKTKLIPYLDGIEGMAGRIQAVNTIVTREGKLVGHNTDWFGALAALEERVDVRGKRVYLLGAGGAGRAIAFGLKERRCHLTIFNRTEERAVALAQELGCEHRSLSSLSRGDENRMNADVLINATSVGMVPCDHESPVPKRVLKEGMIVMDIVYRPLRTRLLAEAEERGCQTIDGLEMLAYQGAAQLELWTGKRPDIGEIRRDLRKAIGK